jgi:hypothetical protein
LRGACQLPGDLTGFEATQAHPRAAMIRPLIREVCRTDRYQPLPNAVGCVPELGSGRALRFLALIRNSRHALGSADQRVARGCVLGGPARKGPTGGWVERRDDEGATLRQDPLIRPRAGSGISDQG